mmetsp:Transcript_1266/g.1388  ORF Transcript_1266/g.1388 Transcript_1266/m.1388 type:complete len:108 (-) Transcript_1266:129-452(-)
MNANMNQFYSFLEHYQPQVLMLFSSSFSLTCVVVVDVDVEEDTDNTGVAVVEKGETDASTFLFSSSSLPSIFLIGRSSSTIALVEKEESDRNNSLTAVAICKSKVIS